MTSLLLQVTMADRAAAERACKEPNPVIDGRKANVNLAYLGAKPRGIQTGESISLASFNVTIPTRCNTRYPDSYLHLVTQNLFLSQNSVAHPHKC